MGEFTYAINKTSTGGKVLNNKDFKVLKISAFIPSIIAIIIGLLALTYSSIYEILSDIILVCFGWIFGYFIFLLIHHLMQNQLSQGGL